MSADERVDGLVELWAALGSQLDEVSQRTIRDFFDRRNSKSVTDLVRRDWLYQFNDELAAVPKVLVLRALAYIEKLSKGAPVEAKLDDHVTVVNLAGRVVCTPRFSSSCTIGDIKEEIERVADGHINAISSPKCKLARQETLQSAGIAPGDILTVIMDSWMELQWQDRLFVSPAKDADKCSHTWSSYTDALWFMHKLEKHEVWAQFQHSMPPEAERLVRMLKDASSIGHYHKYSSDCSWIDVVLVDGHIIKLVQDNPFMGTYNNCTDNADFWMFRGR